MLAAELTGIDEAVFWTIGSHAAFGGWETRISFVNVGREVEGLTTRVGWLSTVVGKLVG
jgi:hypothetical protein